MTTFVVYSSSGPKHGMVAVIATYGFNLLAGYVAARPVSNPLEQLVEAGAAAFRRFTVERLACWATSPVLSGRERHTAHHRSRSRTRPCPLSLVV